jgi:hypothetical protein
MTSTAAQLILKDRLRDLGLGEAQSLDVSSILGIVDVQRC